MTIETLLQESIKATQAATAATLTLIETIKASDALRGEIKEKIEAEAKRASKKSEAKATDEAASERQITTSPEDRKPSEEEKPAAPVELAIEVKAAQDDVAKFVGGAADAEDRADRVKAVRGLLDKLKAARTQDLSPTDAVRLSKAIATLVERFAPKKDEDLL